MYFSTCLNIHTFTSNIPKLYNNTIRERCTIRPIGEFIDVQVIHRTP